MDELTQREKQALLFRHSGLSYKEVAEEMALAEGTVKQYLHHAYEKLGCGSHLANSNLGSPTGLEPKK